ncbi:cellulose binding domain-containing protein [Micromonospora sp. NPDC051925]|uniref:cellulose binding domain-containing protein n=1 Tax=Micromonospora sp. NPDC051925 TaxID=3364288 RepID=UPI0037CA6055
MPLPEVTPPALGRNHHPTPHPVRAARHRWAKELSPHSQSTSAAATTYRTVSSWSGGWQGEVTLKAGNAAINGWTVRWTLGSGQTISQVWSGALTTSGSAASVRNVDYNGSLPASGSTTFGFIGAGTASSPTLSCASP